MLTTLKALFDRLAPPAADRESGRDDEAKLRLASAALLVEMMRMDEHVAEAERQAVLQALIERHAVGEEEVAALVALAEREARQASGYYQFTSLINRTFDLPRKIDIVEQLWRVAFADGRLDAHENHFMRKLGDLLHIPHADFVAAKQRAREGSAAGGDRLSRG